MACPSACTAPRSSRLSAGAEETELAESFVRPPLVAREARSRRAAAIRFWVVFGLILACVLVGAFALYRFATGSTDNGGAVLGPTTVVSATR